MLIDAMNEEMVKALFETVPFEISVIDKNDEVVGWNQHKTRFFYRPEDSMGRNFRQCHPERSLALVERIVNEMKAGTRKSASFWIDATVDKKSGEKHKFLIEYFALHNDKGEYLGCLECARDISGIQALRGEKRLLEGAEAV